LKDFENTGADAERDAERNTASAGYARRAAGDTPLYQAHMHLSRAAEWPQQHAHLYMTTALGKLPLVTFSTLMPRAFNAGSVQISQNLNQKTEHLCVVGTNTQKGNKCYHLPALRKIRGKTRKS
jgi:hypothetical protein